MTDEPSCGPDGHSAPGTRYSDAEIEQAARLFRALSDPARLRTLERLVEDEACVTALAEASDETVSTVSHRLRWLRAEGLVARRRDGRHIYYSLADDHVIQMLQNALVHATESTEPTTTGD